MMKTMVPLMIAGLIMMMISCSGCWDKRELDELGIAAGLGVDLDEQKNVILTAQILKPGQLKSGGGGGQGNGGSGGGNGQKAVHSVTLQGKTVFKAVRNALFQSSRRIFFPHNQVLVIGTAAAENGAQPLLDFFYRDPELRPMQWVLVADGKAADIFKAEPGLENFLAADINRYIENYGNTSEVVPTTLHSFMEAISSKSTSPLAPIIKVTENDGKKRVEIDGTAVFKDDKLVGKLNPMETRGYLWVANQVKSGIISFKVNGGDLAEVEIVHSKGGFQAEIARDEIRVKTMISMQGNVGGLMADRDLTTPKNIQLLQKLVQKAIQKEIKAAFRKEMALKSDFFGIGDALYRRYPRRWMEIKPRLDRLLSRLQVTIKVEAKLRLVGQVSKPATRE